MRRRFARSGVAVFSPHGKDFLAWKTCAFAGSPTQCLLRYGDAHDMDRMVDQVADVTPTGRRFGARLRALMDGLGTPKSGRPITVDALYKMMDNEPDLAISRSHFYKLVEGSALPRLDLIEALARFFGVPASYFVDDHTYLEETIAKVDEAIAQVDAMIQRLNELRVALIRERDNVAEVD